MPILKPHLFFLLIVFSYNVFAQETVEIKNITTLPETKPVSFAKKIDQWSDYKLIGSTDKYLVVLETVQIKAKSSYQYSFAHHQNLHLYNKSNPEELVFSQKVWSQTRSEHAGKASKGLNKHHEDLVPNYRIVGDRIFSMNQHYTKFHAEIKGLWASVLSSYTFEGERLKKKSIKVHTKQNLKISSTFEIAVDSNHLIVYSPGFLTKEEKKKYRYCVNYYDLSLNLAHHIPLEMFPGDAFPMKDKFVQFYVSKQTKKENAYYVGLAIDLESGESYEQKLYEISRGTSYDYHPDFRTAHLLSRINNELTFAYHVKQDDKKVRSFLSTWQFDSGVEFTASDEELSIQRLKETNDGEQEDHQVKYFEFINGIDLLMAKSDIRKEVTVQRIADIYTYSWQVSDYIEGKTYIIGFPLLIYCNHLQKQHLLLLDRFMYSSEYSNMLDVGTPHFLGKNKDVLLFLGSFAEPEVNKKEVHYWTKANQVYQLIEVDITTNEVVRYNVIGEFGDEDKTDFISLHPDHVVRLGNKLCFINTESNADQDVSYLSCFFIE